MRLDNVGIDIYDIHRYFRELTVGQRTPKFWGVTIMGTHKTSSLSLSQF